MVVVVVVVVVATATVVVVVDIASAAAETVGAVVVVDAGVTGAAASGWSELRFVNTEMIPAPIRVIRARRIAIRAEPLPPALFRISVC